MPVKPIYDILPSLPPFKTLCNMMCVALCPEKEGYKLDLLEHNNVSPPTSTLIKDRLRRLTALQIMSSILFVISILLNLQTKKNHISKLFTIKLILQYSKVEIVYISTNQYW